MLCKQLKTNKSQRFFFFSLTFDDLGDLCLVGVKFEGREEAQGAQVEGHDWRDALLWGRHAKDRDV